jgi:hypothetical protein
MWPHLVNQSGRIAQIMFLAANDWQPHQIDRARGRQLGKKIPIEIGESAKASRAFRIDQED